MTDVEIGPDHHQYRDEQIHGENVVVPEYTQEVVGVRDWAQTTFANPITQAVEYFISLFPIAKWILHYNLTWLYGDLIAGITVGTVLVPQSMSYAQVAGLPAQYGLYSSFVGVFIYCFFATSKDVSIGPVAVMSMEVSKVIASVQASHGDKYSAPEIATTLSLICGAIALGLGVLRLGFILEFISMPAVIGFMTGSAFNIMWGQVPGLMGYGSAVNTRDSTYKIVINTLKHLPDTTVDAAFGLVSLAILYAWKYGCEWGIKRYPKYKNYFFYTQVSRNGLVMIFATLFSWAIIHTQGGKPIATLGKVPSGLRNVGVMSVPEGIVDAIAPKLPVATVILLLEHIAISKSFGRVNDYKINPNQEVIAIGVTNLIGTFFNAYPATGSFSRSALKSKCGVRTPLAGIYTGVVVLLALYCLTKAFFYIPKASMSAVIIHAVTDLIAPYTVTWNFWKVAPLDGGIFIICVLITIFSTIENGVYFAVCASVAVLLFRVAKPQGVFLGQVRVAELIDPVIDVRPSGSESSSSSSLDVEITSITYKDSKKAADVYEGPRVGSLSPKIRFHTRWLPLSKENINNGLNVANPPPGVIVFKPVESFTYPNSSRQVDIVSDEAKKLTRRGVPYHYSKPGDRPWNDPAPLKFKLPWSKSTEEVQTGQEVDERPVLRIVHFDFTSVASIDATGVQALVDLRKALNMYADREVEYHFSGILSPWIRRALVNAGFGVTGSAIADRTYFNIGAEYRPNDYSEEEANLGYVAVTATNTPFFHLDIPNYD